MRLWARAHLEPFGDPGQSPCRLGPQLEREFHLGRVPLAPPPDTAPL